MRNDLAKQVKHVALCDAAAGYDVPSGEAVKFFELAGDVEESCGLVPVNFRAYPNGPSVLTGHYVFAHKAASRAYLCGKLKAL